MSPTLDELQISPEESEEMKQAKYEIVPIGASWRHFRHTLPDAKECANVCAKGYEREMYVRRCRDGAVVYQVKAVQKTTPALL